MSFKDSAKTGPHAKGTIKKRDKTTHVTIRSLIIFVYQKEQLIVKLKMQLAWLAGTGTSKP